MKPATARDAKQQDNKECFQWSTLAQRKQRAYHAVRVFDKRWPGKAIPTARRGWLWFAVVRELGLGNDAFDEKEAALGRILPDWLDGFVGG